MITNRRISEIIRESIEMVCEMDAVDFFSNLNKQNGGLTAWNPATKMDRMQPTSAMKSKGTVPTKPFKMHSRLDWARNYRGKGISYEEYMEMDL